LAIAVHRIHWHLLAALAGAADPSRRSADRTGGKSRNDRSGRERPEET
jgi:hypothetical protein